MDGQDLMGYLCRDFVVAKIIKVLKGVVCVEREKYEEWFGRRSDWKVVKYDGGLSAE